MRPSLNGAWDSEKAKRIVNASGLTRKHIAEQLRISVRTLTGNLNGKSPSPQTVKLLAQLLGREESAFLLSKRKSA